MARPPVPVGELVGRRRRGLGRVVGRRRLVLEGEALDAGVLGVVGHVVGARDLPEPVGQGEQEADRRERDDDGREDHGLRQRVAHRGGVLADERRASGPAADDEVEHGDAVADEHHAEQDAHEAAVEGERGAGGDEADGDEHEGEVGLEGRLDEGGGERGHERDHLSCRRPAASDPRLGCLLGDLAVDAGAEAADDVEHHADDDEVDADVEEERGHEVHLAPRRQGEVDGRRLEDRAAERERRERPSRPRRAGRARRAVRRRRALPRRARSGRRRGSARRARGRRRGRRRSRRRAGCARRRGGRARRRA